jgi:hypothetical protein
MNRHFDIRFADADSGCGFSNAQALQVRLANGIRLLRWQTFEQTLHIELCRVRVFESLLDQHLIDCLDQTFALPAPEMIDHLVTSNGKEPCSKGSVTVVRRSPVVHSDERLLNQVLDLISRIARSPAKVRTQQGHKRAEQRSMSGSVAAEPADHQTLEFFLAYQHVHSYVSIRWVKPSGYNIVGVRVRRDQAEDYCLPVTNAVIAANVGIEESGNAVMASDGFFVIP